MPEIEISKTEWDLSPLFSSMDDARMPQQRQKWKLATDRFIKKWKSDNSYLNNEEKLKEALDDYEQWQASYGAAADEFYYFWLLSAQNQNDSGIKAKFSKIDEFSKKIENEMNFFTLSLSKISSENQNIFISSPLLSSYKHFLKHLFAQSKHLLSENEEKIMNLKSKSSYDSWKKMVSEFLSCEERKVLDDQGKPSVKTFSDLSGLMQNKDKKIRDIAAKAFNEILQKHADVAEAELNSILNDKKVNDEIRNYSRPDSARHLADDIESEIVDSLADAVSSKFEIARRFYALKAKLLGLKKLEYHERNVEYGSFDKKYSYEDSVKLVYSVFSSLDSEFAAIMKKLVENGNIDVYPRKGKKGGAFCQSILKSQPTYVLLNHTGTLRDVETLAHELGHAINAELMKKTQNALNFDTPLSTAEVASTFMEDFVTESLMKSSDDESRLALMIQKLNGDISSIIRQISCYRFEQELHKTFRDNGYLSKNEIGKIFQKHMSAYMGPAVEQSEGSENWWVYWGHIRNYFYNYSYASGLLISKAMQNSVRKNPAFIKKVKSFLSAGTSSSPSEIFAELGIDIADKKFWLSGLHESEYLLNEAEALAKKLKKI